MLYTNVPITDSFWRKGADNGLPLPQLKEYPSWPHRSVCNVLFFTLLYSIATYAKYIIYIIYRLQAVAACL